MQSCSVIQSRFNIIIKKMFVMPGVQALLNRNFRLNDVLVDGGAMNVDITKVVM